MIFRRIIPLLFIIGCAPAVVNFTNDSANFKSFNTYTLVNLKANHPELSEEGEKLMTDIEKAIYAQMNRRGYTYSNSTPDLIIRYEIISNQETDVSYNNSSFGGSFYRPSMTVRTFLQSALLFEMTDFKTKKLVWESSVDVKNYDSIKNQEELITKAVSQMFDTYLHRAQSTQIDATLKEGK